MRLLKAGMWKKLVPRTERRLNLKEPQKALLKMGLLALLQIGLTIVLEDQ